MDHKVESERALNGREHGDENMHKIFIAAGTTLAMACLKRITVMFFVEQWRTRVFLILNLVLLAILFTSIHSSSSDNENDQESNDNSEMKIQENKKRKECGLSTKTNKPHQVCHKLFKRTKDKHELEQEHIKVDSDAQKFSKEELNERVEAFIAMFRQHLVSDARKSRNQLISRSKQSDMFNLHKGSNQTISSVG